MRFSAGLLPILLVSAGPALGQAGDVSNGEKLAEAHCAKCHALTESKGQEVDGRYVPSLAEVANTPLYSLVRLRRIIAVPPHSGMPKEPLSTEEINDLAYYIESLRKQTD
jgi:mono/diheme cytochrome c family protein